MELVRKLALIALAAWTSDVAHGANVRFDNFNSPSPFVVGDTPIPTDTGFVAVGASSLNPAELAAIDTAAARDVFAASFVQLGSSAKMGEPGFPFDGFIQRDFEGPIDLGSALVDRNILIVIGDGDSIVESEHLAIVRSQTTFARDFPLFITVVRLGVDFSTTAELVLGTRDVRVSFPELGGMFLGISLQKIHPLPPATIIDPINSIALTEAGLRITVPTASRRNIGVEYSQTAEPNSWITLGNFSPIDGATSVFTDPDFIRLGRRRGFYRAFLRPLPDI